jgi:hypothetical protein
MDNKTRREIYLQQTGRKELTGKQKKRAAKKEHRRSRSRKQK